MSHGGKVEHAYYDKFHRKLRKYPMPTEIIILMAEKDEDATQ